MTIDDAKDYLREHWPSIRPQLLDGTYQPQPVKLSRADRETTAR
jgi:RNA-directed DNA polymerase